MKLWEIRKMDDDTSCKRDESVFFVFTFSITPEIEIEIRGDEESGSFQESHDKEKVKLVIKRVANKDRLATLAQ